jgi:hypothetical protein
MNVRIMDSDNVTRSNGIRDAELTVTEKYLSVSPTQCNSLSLGRHDHNFLVQFNAILIPQHTWQHDFCSIAHCVHLHTKYIDGLMGGRIEKNHKIFVKA